MDISMVNTDALVMSIAKQEQSQSRVEAQVGLLKDVQGQQEDAIMSLMQSVPVPDANGRLGTQVDLRV